MSDQNTLKRIRYLVDAQADDLGLWFGPPHVTESYLQDALRNLHGLIESLPKDVCRHDWVKGSFIKTHCTRCGKDENYPE